MLFVVSAPSGAGKTSLCRTVKKICDKVENSLSTTTRPLREGEKNGVDYLFVPEEEFLKGAEEGRFAEWARVHGHFYGTPIENILEAEAQEIDLTLAIDVQGARQVREKFDKVVSVFVLPPSREELQKRLQGRETESREEIEHRLRNAGEEIEHLREYDYLIINDKLEDAVEIFRSIIIAERARVSNLIKPEGIEG